MKMQPLFFGAWAVLSLILCAAGYSFETVQKGTVESCKKAISPILILLCSGAMIGVWNLCGTIPAFTLAGISLLQSRWYLPAAFLMCFLFAFITGTVFGTCGTIGVVFLTIGKVMKFPEELCLGAITAGSFFGYGLSPVADCTNMAASIAKVDLSESIRFQSVITVPAVVVFLLVFTGRNQMLSLESFSFAQQEQFAAAIRELGCVGWPAVLPVLVVFVFLLRRQATILSLIAGTLAGGMVAVFFCGCTLEQVMQAFWGGASFENAPALIAALFERGGIKSMTDTVLLFFFAFSFFGLLETCGGMKIFLTPLLKWADTRRKGAFTAVLFGFLTNLFSASAMCSFVFTFTCLTPVYEERGWNRLELVRAGFVGCLYFSLLIPWHSNVVTPAALLGTADIQTAALPCLAAAVSLFLFFTYLRRKK